MTSAPSEARRSRATAPKRLQEAKRRLDEQLFTECAPTQAYERYRAARQ